VIAIRKKPVIVASASVVCWRRQAMQSGVDGPWARPLSWAHDPLVLVSARGLGRRSKRCNSHESPALSGRSGIAQGHRRRPALETILTASPLQAQPSLQLGWSQRIRLVTWASGGGSDQLAESRSALLRRSDGVGPLAMSVLPVAYEEQER